MPTANVYFSSEKVDKDLLDLSVKLKPFLADKLTCGEIKLNENEISVRLVKVLGSAMIENLEIEITAFSFPERVEKQDQICLEVRDFIKKEYPDLGEVKVWLILSELGHSWE